MVMTRKKSAGNLVSRIGSYREALSERGELTYFDWDGFARRTVNRAAYKLFGKPTIRYVLDWATSYGFERREADALACMDEAIRVAKRELLPGLWVVVRSDERDRRYLRYDEDDGGHRKIIWTSRQPEADRFSRRDARVVAEKLVVKHRGEVALYEAVRLYGQVWPSELPVRFCEAERAACNALTASIKTYGDRRGMSSMCLEDLDEQIYIPDPCSVPIGDPCALAYTVPIESLRRFDIREFVPERFIPTATTETPRMKVQCAACGRDAVALHEYATAGWRCRTCLTKAGILPVMSA